MSTRENQILARIKNRIQEKDSAAEVILFGSRARGDAKPEPDWDILILLNQPEVTRAREREFRHHLFDLELEIGEPISTFVFSKLLWKSKHAVTPFYRSIQSEGILL